MAKIEIVSTKSIHGSKEVICNFREEEDIERYINFVLNGNHKEAPTYSSSTGFVSSKTDARLISTEVKQIQKLYRKDKGLRIRGEIVLINNDELTQDNLDHSLVRKIADRFSSYYLGLGFQNIYGVYEKDEHTEIRYALNPVCFADGSKYHHNDKEIKDNEELCINTIIAEEVGMNIPEGQNFDFDTLEFSDYVGL